jgi:hypothetical protein
LPPRAPVSPPARPTSPASSSPRRWGRHAGTACATARLASAVGQMFADADIAYAHVRSATNGCFTYRVERAA